jgi:hypothetical protein
MAARIEAVQNTIVEELLAEFNEGLRSEGRARFEVLQRCPEPQKRELLALMNVATLAYRALEPDRQALHATKKRKIAL